MSRSQQLSIDQAISRAKKANKQGNFALALQLYTAVLQQQANHPVAKKALRKLQKRLPPGPSQEQIIALNNLYHSGQMEMTERSCRELLKSFPQSLNVINVLGAALQVQGKFIEAVQAFDRAIDLKPDFAEAFSNRGNALKELGQMQHAVASYDNAIQLNPDFADAWFNRGNALKDLGKLGQAIESYNKTLKLAPDFAPAHRNLSALKTFIADDKQIAAMESLISNPRSRDSDRMELSFALAKACEDLADYDKSFEYLKDGNRLRKNELSYDIDDDRQMFARIKATFTSELPIFDPDPEETASIRAFFIVGMMRSGTSLVEQILASHSRVHGAGELETMNQLVSPIISGLSDGKIKQESARLSAADVGVIRDSYLETLSGLDVAEKIITDKMPLNFRWIGFILAAFPDAKIIHVDRDPMATCWSNYKHFFPAAGNGYAYDLNDLAEFYGLYKDLLSFWHERFPNRIYDIRYEDLTENQEEETRKLLTFGELDWEDQCIEFHKTRRAVRTSSAGQVRMAMYRGSSDAWRHYSDHLQPLLSALQYPL